MSVMVVGINVFVCVIIYKNTESPNVPLRIRFGGTQQSSSQSQIYSDASKPFMNRLCCFGWYNAVMLIVRILLRTIISKANEVTSARLIWSPSRTHITFHTASNGIECTFRLCCLFSARDEECLQQTLTHDINKYVCLNMLVCSFGLVNHFW